MDGGRVGEESGAAGLAVAGTRPRTSARATLHVRFLICEAVLALLFVLLALAVKRHPGPLPGDVAIERAVQMALLPHHLLAAALEAISTLNFPTPAVITLAVLTVVFLLLRRFLDILSVIITAAVTDGTQYVISAFVHRPRPSDHGLHIMAVLKSSYSFPSGHVTYAVAVFGLLIYLSYQVRRPVHPAVLWAVRALLLATILLMPVSRLLEGEHWPSDVLGGALYGAFWLLIATHVYIWARRRWPVLLAPDER